MKSGQAVKRPSGLAQEFRPLGHWATGPLGHFLPGLSVWLRELRAPFFTGSAVPAVFGAAYAAYSGVPFDWPRFLLALFGAVLAHAGVNMANDYYDHLSGDDLLTPRTPVSGGSKVIQEGLLAPKQVLVAATISLCLAAAIGLYLVFLPPPLTPRPSPLVLVAVGLLGLFIAWFYAAPPVKLGHRKGAGEIACLLGCGPVIVSGAYVAQAGRLTWQAVLVGLPIGILMAMVLFINEFHDRDADGQVGKNTLVVVLGTRASARVLAWSLAATYLAIAGLVVFDVLPLAALAAFLTAPLAVFAALRARRFHSDSARLLPANFAVIGTHLLTGVILTVALLVMRA